MDSAIVAVIIQIIQPKMNKAMVLQVKTARGTLSKHVFFYILP